MDELIRLDTTITGIDSLINKASTADEAKVLFAVKDVIYSQQRYFTDVQPIYYAENVQNEVLNYLFNKEREAESMSYGDKRQERIATIREIIRFVKDIDPRMDGDTNANKHQPESCPYWEKGHWYLKDHGTCNGTKEREPCKCDGDRSKCEYYPEKRGN